MTTSDDGFSSYEEDRPPDEPPEYAAFYRETVPGLITMLQLSTTR